MTLHYMLKKLHNYPKERCNCVSNNCWGFLEDRLFRHNGSNRSCPREEIEHDSVIEPYYLRKKVFSLRCFPKFYFWLLWYRSSYFTCNISICYRSCTAARKTSKMIQVYLHYVWNLQQNLKDFYIRFISETSFLGLSRVNLFSASITGLRKPHDKLFLSSFLSRK